LKNFLNSGRIIRSGYGGTKREEMTKIRKIIFDGDGREPSFKKKSGE
jgi:hypothetical protein